MKFGENAAEGIIKNTDILEDEEHIQWARTPQENAYKFTTRLLGLLVFIVVWFMMLPLYVTGSNLTQHLIFQGIGISIGLILVGIVVYVRNSSNRVEAYALTNQRVVHYFHSALGFRQNVDDLYLEQIVDVDMSKSGVTAKLFDVGNILFSRRGSQSATSGGGAGSAVAFKLVTDPKNTHQSLRRTIIKEVGGGALSMKDIDSYRKGRSLEEAEKKKGAGMGEGDLQEVNAQLKEIKEILKSIDAKL